MTSALIYAIHGTHDWWACLGRNLAFDRVTVLTDRRGHGDRWCTDAFYESVRRRRATGDLCSALLSVAEVDDVIARCRVLRWKRRKLAVTMVLAMADALDRELDAVAPTYVISFPIDNYVQDVLARLARRRGIAYFELAISPLPDMCMLMHRGRLIVSEEVPDEVVVEANVRALADPLFTPIYVKDQPAYTHGRFLKTIGYFRLRSVYFRLYSLWRNDLLNIHYLDAQSGLGHKADIRDLRVIQMIDGDWSARIDAFPRERRVMFGLQLFPEASIDYWIENRDLLRHEDLLIEIARHLSSAGFVIVVKDHPLQFGFRRTEFIERLKAFSNVVFAPYEVSGNALLERCGVSVTATGTLGLQAALLGNVSVTTGAYYVTPGDFVVLDELRSIETLSPSILAHGKPQDLRERQGRIVERLLRGSFRGDFISFRGFDAGNPNPSVAELGRALGRRLLALGPDGEDWHRRNMPVGGGRHDGSPLN